MTSMYRARSGWLGCRRSLRFSAGQCSRGTRFRTGRACSDGRRVRGGSEAPTRRRRGQDHARGGSAGARNASLLAMGLRPSPSGCLSCPARDSHGLLRLSMRAMHLRPVCPGLIAIRCAGQARPNGVGGCVAGLAGQGAIRRPGPGLPALHVRGPHPPCCHPSFLPVISTSALLARPI